ncbi:hypothetical protein KIW84_030944 [Lathyrus oleraceus]|uniref:Pentatricopeptide repeat-containing protein n=1 Tax=Pisum sativum TaxID=3888 RepID=A0A9D4XPI5_PEA|nr:hypothetical protein KIW84_030944 [Pisum sativum]
MRVASNVRQNGFIEDDRRIRRTAQNFLQQSPAETKGIQEDYFLSDIRWKRGQRVPKHERRAMVSIREYWKTPCNKTYPEKSHSGLIKERIQRFDIMISKYELVPNSEHYAITVDLLGRMGELNTALDVINNMPMQAGSDIWGASLSYPKQKKTKCNVTQVLESKKRKGPELQASSQVVQSVLRLGSSICNVDADIQPKSEPNLNPRSAMAPVVSKRKVMQATTTNPINRIWGEYYSSHLLEGIGEGIGDCLMLRTATITSSSEATISL